MRGTRAGAVAVAGLALVSCGGPDGGEGEDPSSGRPALTTTGEEPTATPESEEGRTTTGARPPAAPEPPPPEPARLRLARVATGLEAPTHATAAPGEPRRLYVVEQPGTVRIVRGGRARRAPFLDIRDRVASGGERGLLSLAFHPAYEDNRRLYVNYTNRAGHTRVVEYRANAARTAVEPGSARVLLAVRQPYANHNGGQLAFGPDGRLYVGMGDGGSGGDPEDRAQNLRDRLGKLLRLDVDDEGRGWQIAAYGLRNPWRFSFDRETGDLYVADVGQDAREEVNYVRWPPGALLNLGWDVYEGDVVHEDKRPNRAGRLVRPVAVYGRGRGCSVTGGFVYRGRAMPGLHGRYFYGDYCSGTVWSFRIREGGARAKRRERFRVPALSSFGEDGNGELVLVSLSGDVFRLVGR